MRRFNIINLQMLSQVGLMEREVKPFGRVQSSQRNMEWEYWIASKKAKITEFFALVDLLKFMDIKIYF